MRYTTLIDISEIPAIWRNDNAIKLYVTMVLKCGYHDEDRDKLKAGYRTLAAAAGITEDACRHALSVLQREGLLRRDGDSWLVTKYVAEKKPTARSIKAAGGVGVFDVEERQRAERKEQQQREREDKMRIVMKGIKAASIDDLARELDKLRSGREAKIEGIRLAADDSWIKTFEYWIDLKKQQK